MLHSGRVKSRAMPGLWLAIHEDRSLIDSLSDVAITLSGLTDMLDPAQHLERGWLYMEPLRARRVRAPQPTPTVMR